MGEMGRMHERPPGYDVPVCSRCNSENVLAVYVRRRDCSDVQEPLFMGCFWCFREKLHAHYYCRVCHQEWKESTDEEAKYE